MVTLLPPSAQGDRNTVVGSFILPETLEETYLLLMTAQGRVKRIPLTEFTDLTGRGLTLLKLKEDDQLAYINLVETGDQFVLATSGGRLLRLEVNDEQLPILSRTAQGNLAIRIRKQEKLAGCAVIYQEDDLLLLSEQGYAKRLPTDAVRLSSVGELGTQAFQFTKKQTFWQASSLFSQMPR